MTLSILHISVKVKGKYTQLPLYLATVAAGRPAVSSAVGLTNKWLCSQ